MHINSTNGNCSAFILIYGGRYLIRMVIWFGIFNFIVWLNIRMNFWFAESNREKCVECAILAAYPRFTLSFPIRFRNESLHTNHLKIQGLRDQTLINVKILNEKWKRSPFERWHYPFFGPAGSSFPTSDVNKGWTLFFTQLFSVRFFFIFSAIFNEFFDGLARKMRENASDVFKFGSFQKNRIFIKIIIMDLCKQPVSWLWNDQTPHYQMLFLQCRTIFFKLLPTKWAWTRLLLASHNDNSIVKLRQFLVVQNTDILPEYRKITNYLWTHIIALWDL